MKRAIFTVVLLAALVLFTWTVRRFARLILAGRPDVRTDHPGQRVGSLLTYFFGQKKVVEKTVIPAARASRLVSAIGSKYHFIIFWGFILITVGTGETLIQGMFPSFTLSAVLGETLADFLYASIDVANVLVLAMIAFAVFRRVVLRPRLIPMSRDAAAILGAIAALMITHYGIHGLRAAAGAPDPALPISNAIGAALSGMPGATALSEVSWWLHVLIVLGFLNYLLYSKHSHIIAALPNIYFRKLGQRGVLPKLNMEADDMAATGVVSEFKDFTWKSLLDGYACTECARCSNFCPAYNTGKPLSPMQVIHDVRDDMKSRMPDKGPLDHMIERFQHGAAAEPVGQAPTPLIGGRTTEDVLWACTTCGACQEVCPVFTDHPEKIIQMRQNLVLVQEKVPSDLARTFTNLERNGNPWGLAADKRLDWAEGKGIPTLDDKPDAEYLLWVGCAGAYDDRIKKQTLALVDVLREGGVDFAVLGLEEGCTGDPARRS
ncbi:MAG TPA: (Fe-S)-binding protein, partial [Polyangia bacterium]|nr:(Fe-S)-binding protein [Polyangia bacterium]